MMKRILFIAAIQLLVGHHAAAQKEMTSVFKGNRQYNKESYTDAEINYRKGLEQNDKSFEAHFNLGNSLFRQEKYPEAAEEYAKAAALIQKEKDGKYSAASKERMAQAMHNLGNSYYGMQDYGKAVEAYKASLMCNPKDDETRYNLIKAMRKMQQQQDQDQQQNQDQQQQEQQEQQQQEAQAEAEQILQALEQYEQTTQENLNRQHQSKNRNEKDW